MATIWFSFLIWKDAVFCQIKTIKHSRGDVVLYVAQANALIVAELVKKGAFRTETKGNAVAANQEYREIHDLPLPVAVPSVLAVCR